MPHSSKEGGTLRNVGGTLSVAETQNGWACVRGIVGCAVVHFLVGFSIDGGFVFIVLFVPLFGEVVQF